MKTPITYYGGKQTLAPRIIRLFPDHKIYCEPFFGGGAVFFEKPKSYLEAINDKNDRLITFYKQVIYNFDELSILVANTLDSESEYIRARDIYNDPEGHKDVDIAWAVWIVTNQSFAGTPRGGWKWCNGSAGSHTGKVLRHKREAFTAALRERLAEVQISCGEALDVIRKRDTAQTLFYLDPPYPGCDQKHYSGYSFEDFQELLSLLEIIKGKFILSNYNSDLLTEFIDKNGWHKDEIVMASKTANFTVPQSKTEVLVYNFDKPQEINLFNY